MVLGAASADDVLHPPAVARRDGAVRDAAARLLRRLARERGGERVGMNRGPQHDAQYSPDANPPPPSRSLDSCRVAARRGEMDMQVSGGREREQAVDRALQFGSLD